MSSPSPLQLNPSQIENQKSISMDIETEVEAEYNNYWETKRFYEELDNSWEFDETLYDSSSPELPASASSSPPEDPRTARNIEMERNRRRKMNDKLYALRSVVPKISKMDKVSIVKDAIDYILELQQEERRMMAEVAELEKSPSPSSSSVSRIAEDVSRHLTLSKGCRKRRRSSIFALGSPGKPFIEVTELRVCEAGERTLVVSITCNKKKDTMIKLCELFDSLNLNIVSANITSVCGSLLHTLFVETDDMTSDQLKEKIEVAIAEYDHNAITSPMNSS